MDLKTMDTYVENNKWMKSFSLVVNNWILQNIDDVFGIFHGQTHWWLNSESVSESSSLAEQDLSFSGQLHHVVSDVLRWLLGLFVLDEFKTDHQTSASDVTDNFVFLFKFGQLSKQVVSDLFGV